VSVRFAVILLAYVVTSTAGLLLLRSQLKREDVELLSVATLTNGQLLLGGLLYCASFAFWMLALARFDLTTAYPFFIGASYTSITVCAVAFLDESFTFAKGLGTLLVGVGLLLVASGASV
jgi:multidrug transporter EmrE-like cation transporter